MRISRWRSSQWLGGAVAAALATVLSLALRFIETRHADPGGEPTGFPLGQALLQLGYDLPFRFRRDLPTTQAVVVYIDEDTYTPLGQHQGTPIDHAWHAKLVRKLNAAGAKAIVFDLLFIEEGRTNAVADFAAAMLERTNVVIGAYWRFAQPHRAVQGATTTFPIDSLRDAAGALGLVNFLKGTDGAIREHASGREVGADWLPSLAWAGAEVAHDPITADPAAARRKRWLNYYGPPLRLPKIPYHQALLQPVPEGFFRDKVVFVGAGATVGLPGEIKDEFAGPHTRWTGRLHSGVEIQATAYLNLARKDWLTRLPGGWELLLLVLTGTALGCGLAGLRPAWASLAAVLFLLGLGGVAVWLFVHARVWFSWTLIAVVQLPVAWGCSVVWNSIRLYGEKKALEQSLALHLSPARVRQILRRPELLRPGAEEQEISILFSDIANFTRLTSRMPSADLFRLLNDYYEVALSCIHETDGTVVNLIGDAIFAIWNAPFTQPDQQARAFQSALLLREKLVQFEANQRSLPLHTRVGLHTGLAHVGNLGSSKRFEYTAVGDSVNLASRLEGLNKQTGTDILATRDIQRLVENHVASRSLGFFRFKGFDRIIEVHELLGPAALAPSTEPWRKTFQDGMFHFQRKAFDPAEAAFRQTLALKPEDGPSLFYLDRLREVRLTPPPDEWAGEITLKEK